MQFASKTPRDLNWDPLPYASTHPDFERYSNADDYEGRHGVVHDPRPEYDHAQHNEPNPVLVFFREDGKFYSSYRVAARTWLHYWSTITIYSSTVSRATRWQIDHAHRVLSRLERLGAI